MNTLPIVVEQGRKVIACDDIHQFAELINFYFDNKQ